MELAGRQQQEVKHYPPGAEIPEKVLYLRAGLQNLLEYWDIRRDVRQTFVGKKAPQKLLDRTAEAALRNMAYLSHVDAQQPAPKAAAPVTIPSSPPPRQSQSPSRSGSWSPKSRSPQSRSPQPAAGGGGGGAEATDEIAALLPHLDEPVDHVYAARVAWEASINEELVAIANEKAQPLMCRAQDKGKVNHQGREKTSAEAGAKEEGRRQVRFLYDSDDLLDVIENLNPDNTMLSQVHMVPLPWALVRFHVKTPDLEEMRRRFHELAPHFRQCGLDDLPDGGAGGTRPGLNVHVDRNEHQDVINFASERQRDGRTAISSRFPPVARAFARRGVPNNLRPQLWRTALGLHDTVTEEELDYYASLRVRTEEESCITDELFSVDAEFCGYDDHYFMFGEMLESVLLCFSRDSLIHELEAVHPHAPLFGRVLDPEPNPAPRSERDGTGKRRMVGSTVVTSTDAMGLLTDRTKLAGQRVSAQRKADAFFGDEQLNLLARGHELEQTEKALTGDEYHVMVPPSGVQPFRGFVRYVAPMTYLYEEEEEAYFVLRAMWCKYWCKINAIRSAPDTLVCLWRTFETLLGEAHPALAMHLGAINAPPLRNAKHWIQHGFVGFLEVDQVLLLWDRIIGFDDLMVLPVLAAAVFTFRAPVLLRCGSAIEAKEVINDGSMLQVVPLLQSFLFPESVADLDLGLGLGVGFTGPNAGDGKSTSKK
mmetsp:Transcript_15315/g.46036  ORF Transcript_15315/g.46036 Transcript_15315/m.46036 type:complete len:708 (-) Transcript_15315:135-2258(-)